MKENSFLTSYFYLYALAEFLQVCYLFLNFCPIAALLPCRQLEAQLDHWLVFRTSSFYDYEVIGMRLKKTADIELWLN